MSNKPYIISIDDEQLNQEIIQDLLEEDFNIELIDNGQACFESIKQKVPDLILLDVNMPVMNGLEVCKQLRADENYQDIPIIFVSALVSPKERLAGYEAGGDDYLTKPFNEKELLTKINLLLKIKAQKDKQQQENKYATDTAMSAMTSAAEAGVVLHFMRSILPVTNLDTLEFNIFEAFNSYGIEGCIKLNHTDSPIYLFSDDIIRPIEKDVLDETQHMGRIIEFSGRAVFNGEHASILIRRMPIDEDKRGRYKDHLALLIDALEAKLLQFIDFEKKQKHFFALEQTVKVITQILQQTNQSYQQQRSLNTAILGEMAQNIEESFLTLGLDEIQEKTLLKLITNAETKTDRVFEKGLATEKTFAQIIADLTKLLK
jgi:DNA-binding response OmpR family regulator